MSDLLVAIDELLARATTSGTLQDLQRTTGSIQQSLSQASPEDQDEALRRLSAALPRMHPIPAAMVATTCGALVETGGDPHVSGSAVLALVPDTLDRTIQFHELCWEKERAEHPDQETDEDDEPEAEELAEKHFQAVAEENPEAAWAYVGERDVTLAAIAHLRGQRGSGRRPAAARNDCCGNRSNTTASTGADTAS